MGMFDAIRHQLIDIIEWTDDTRDTIVWRFPRYENEIKNGAKLIVRESQVAAFVLQGQLADVFQPGTFTLQTQNLPILSTLAGWKYGFNSPFKAEVYFVSTRTFTDRKWGTQNPIMMRDPEFGPVRVRAFGSFGIKVKDAGTFIKNIAGTEARFTTDEIEQQLKEMVVSRFSDALGNNKMPVLDLAGNYDKVGRWAAAAIQPDFDTFGLQICNFIVENISLPPEVEAAIDKRSSMGVIGNMQAYTQYESASAIRDAAKNPGGLAGAGAGLAAGYQMASQMGQAFSAPAGPPPVPQPAAYFIAINGAQSGPHAVSDLSAKAASGQFTRQTLVWKQGMASWVAADSVAELSNLFAAAPPPLPKT
ncbi:MAG TPA: SPFH domain-containing protein [Tepidisphaeraceae bacterium]|jgi:membrane protease subunit (stomatin/prohibitin family)